MKVNEEKALKTNIFYLVFLVTKTGSGSGSTTLVITGIFPHSPVHHLPGFHLHPNPLRQRSPLHRLKQLGIPLLKCLIINLPIQKREACLVLKLFEIPKIIEMFIDPQSYFSSRKSLFLLNFAKKIGSLNA